MHLYTNEPIYDMYQDINKTRSSAYTIETARDADVGAHSQVYSLT